MPEANRREIVVITGGTAGIGRATAREFAQRGADVAVLARGRERLDSTCREIEALGCRAVGISVDVADGDAVEAAAARIERELGPIDIWINNAFAGMFSTFLDMTPDEYRRVTDVSYFGQVHGTRAALKRLMPRDRGMIVLVGSALAYRGIPLQSAYCGAKHALQGFLDALRPELAYRGSKVRMCMVQLPAVNTPQFDWARAHIRHKPRPAGKIYQPEVAARAIHFAAHASRKEVWVGRMTVQAILADELASPLLDEYLAETGVTAQASGEPIEADRRDNLFEPVPGDPGAHGRFDQQASSTSVQMALNRHRNLLAGAAGLLAVAGLGWTVRRRRNSR
jgi:NAD(P)-dependent dehydrogenase (short-subunit alcohol dehydrogenase family)